MKRLLRAILTIILTLTLIVSQSTSLAVNAVDDENSVFQIFFLDVGQADAAVVQCDDSYMLIDGGNAEDSNLIYSFLKKHEIKNLDYIVCTHAHEDHVGGLSGALNYATVDTAFCPVTSYDSKAFKNFVKYLKKQNVEITVPKPGDTYDLGSAEFEILGPIEIDEDEPNDTSIVLRIVYGETSFLFTGDAGRDEEADILEEDYDLESTVLKVGHHGSATSTSYKFLNEVLPKYAVISVGKDNSYGHPNEDTLSRLRDADVMLLRTDMQGDIRCESDGKKVSFYVEKNADADTYGGLEPNSTQKKSSSKTSSKSSTKSSGTVSKNSAIASSQNHSQSKYVLNTNTKKFHLPECSSVKDMSPKNRQDYEGSRDDIIAMGYEPCKRCNP